MTRKEHDNNSSKSSNSNNNRIMMITTIIVIVIDEGCSALSRLARSMRNAERMSLNTLTVVAVSGQMVVAVQALSSIRQLSITWASPVGEVMALTQLLSFDFDLAAW